MILIIDNYDSFVHNLARYVALTGADYKIMRNDEITLKEIAALNPDAIILSPGPRTPREAGICVSAVKKFGKKTPILGVCLGHQCIGEAYGAQTIRGKAPMHGKPAIISHNGAGLFKDLPTPMTVGRYHSLITFKGSQSDLITTAESDDGTIMAMEHKRSPVYGVQFHPESILTEHGHAIIQNFMDITHNWNQKKSAA